MYEKRQLPVVVLQGTPRERGRIHGETCRDKIRDLIRGWKDRLYQTVGMPADEYLDQFLEDTDFLSAIEKWTPDLVEEIRGISEGAGLDFKTAYAHQLADEEWWYRDKTIGCNKGPAGKACSAIGVPRSNAGPTLLAQTLDLPDYYEGYLVLLKIKYPNHQAMVITEAGVIGAHGLNSRSVGVCANTLSQLGTSTQGLPVDLVIRGVLAQPSLQDAITFIRSIKHATGQNYVIGGLDSVYDFECSGNGVTRYTPSAGAAGICHTNHPLANNDVDDFNRWVESLDPAARGKSDGEQENTRTRLESLERQLGATGEVTVDSLKAILCSHDSETYPICRHKRPWDESITASGTIMVLGSDPVLYLAPGLPCSTPFERYEFDK
ncbi:MAG: hypothetical protein JXA42_16825 [Anaerolineales bacterium]|nr:hypothetical protein [Anaerolineales bacterium]